MAHRVLLVDDTPQIAELLTFSLRDHGFEVTSVGYTIDLSEDVADAGASAVVLNCTTYDMSESLFDSLRSDPRHAQLPVILISDTPELAVESLRARAAEHVLLVPKPFSGSQVARALQQLLGSGNPLS